MLVRTLIASCIISTSMGCLPKKKDSASVSKAKNDSSTIQKEKEQSPQTNNQTSPEGIPELFYADNWLFNRYCEDDLPPGGEEEEFQPQRIPVLTTSEMDRFIGLWQARGPELLVKLLSEFNNKGFSRKEYTVTFSLCGKGSISHPLIIGLSRYMPDARYRDPDHAFVDTLFHELIHNWLVDNFAFEESALLESLEIQDDLVANHIHLMAIQKYLYEKMGASDLADWLKTYQHFPGAYREAWIIADKHTEALVQEIKSQLAPSR